MTHRYYTFFGRCSPCDLCHKPSREGDSTPKRQFPNTKGETVGIQNLQATTGDQATVFIDLWSQPYPNSIL